MSKKLSGKEFVEELRKGIKKTSLLNKDYFVIVGQLVEDEEVEDTSIVLVKENTKKVLCSFSYDTNGLIYNLSFGSISFIELCELTDTIKSILDHYNF